MTYRDYQKVLETYAKSTLLIVSKKLLNKRTVNYREQVEELD